MEDKIKEIDTALNSLKRDEEQLIKELNRLSEKYQTKNGKLVEPREVTKYKRDLEEIRKEIEQKDLQKRRYVLLREKERLSDENVIKNLKNMYRNEKNADKMINEMLKQRNKEIDSKIAEIEDIIRIVDEPEMESPDIDEVLKTMEERSKESSDRMSEESINLEDIAIRLENIADQQETDEIKVEEDIQPAEESEEPVQPEIEDDESEKEEEIKNTIIIYMEQEIEKINEVLKSYDDLKKNIDTLVSDAEEQKDKTDNLQSNFGKIKKEIDELSRRKTIAETIKGLVDTDLAKAKQEYEAYEKESQENKEKLDKAQESIESLNDEYENVKKDLEKERNEEETNRKQELLELIDNDMKIIRNIFEPINFINDNWPRMGYVTDTEEDLFREEIEKYMDERAVYSWSNILTNMKILRIDVEANKVGVKEVYKEHNILQEMMKKNEKEIKEIQKISDRTNEYIQNVEGTIDEHYRNMDKAREEIEKIVEEYKGITNLKSNSRVKSLGEGLKVYTDAALRTLPEFIFDEFYDDKDSIIEENKDLSLEEKFNILEEHLVFFKKLNEHKIETYISNAKDIMEDIRKELDIMRDMEQEEKEEAPEILEDEYEEVKEAPEIIEEAEEVTEIIDEDEKIEEAPEIINEEEVEEDYEVSNEEENIQESNETDAPRNKGKLKAVGKKFLKGVGKVRRRNLWIIREIRR